MGTAVQRSLLAPLTSTHAPLDPGASSPSITSQRRCLIRFVPNFRFLRNVNSQRVAECCVCVHTCARLQGCKENRARPRHLAGPVAVHLSPRASWQEAGPLGQAAASYLGNARSPWGVASLGFSATIHKLMVTSWCSWSESPPIVTPNRATVRQQARQSTAGCRGTCPAWAPKGPSPAQVHL